MSIPGNSSSPRSSQQQVAQGNQQAGEGGQNKIQVSELSLPKGGGAIQGIGETFQANEFSGTAGLSIPIAASPCRDSAPGLSVEYSSGGGNGPWGMGFSLSIPQISRQTRLGTPKYTNTDIFVLSGAADLVPLDDNTRTDTLEGITYTIQAFRPRQEGLFALIEYWQPEGGPQGEAFWKVTSKDHTISIYGKTEQAKIADPEDANRVFTWLLEERYNPQGDHQLFFYKQENSDNVPDAIYEKGHVKTAQRYIERIRYGNQTAKADSMLFTNDPAITDPSEWHFEVVFDYGEYKIEASPSDPYTPVSTWACRPDPFSTYHAGFEIRTYRRCFNVLMFHRFADELGAKPVLTHATTFDYAQNYAQLSELVSVTQTGYSYDKDKKTYTTATLPPLTLAYTPFQPTGHAFVPLTDEQGDALSGLDNAPHTLVDLFGEGIPGILYSDGATTYYRDPVPAVDNSSPSPPSSGTTTAPLPLAATANSGNTIAAYADWQTLEEFPVSRRVEGAGISLQDIDGNGQLDVVMNQRGVNGYWEAQLDRTWKNFLPFETWPADFPEPAQTWVDMTGDGVADLVQLTAQEVLVYPSARTQGLGKCLVQQKEKDSGLPASLESSPTELVRFADMAGSGQSHLVRIRSGEVTYWPNLSYGRLGAPITMGNAPAFCSDDFGSEFNTAQLFLADLDGSGTTDLIYMQSKQATIYFNQNGNVFSDPVTLALPVPLSFDDMDQVRFADVYGQGNACLILSNPHAMPDPQYWCYDFCQGQKPYLLCGIDNSMGATTEITYGSSVDFYLADKKAGLSWITALPFPVQVITQLTHSDAIAGSRYTSLYSYHHGYYDGVEREFRGFGMVERQDAEHFRHSEAATDANYVAPALSRTWYHTGAYLEKEALSRQYANEYYTGDKAAFDFPDSTIDWGEVTPEGETERQACVAMAGTVLRAELYGLDDTSLPYTVSESNFYAKLLQDKGDHPYAIFFVHPEQSLSYTYERNAEDPQIHQEFTVQVDAWGHTQRACSIAYPRRTVPTVEDPIEQNALTEGQGKVKATVALSAYYNSEDDPMQVVAAPDQYLLGVATESQGYELSEQLDAIYKEQTGTALTLAQVQQAINALVGEATHSLTLPAPPESVSPLSWERIYYAQVTENVTKKLALGQVGLPLLLFEHHVAEFSQDQVSDAFRDTPLEEGEALTQQLQAGYYQLDTNYWWNPGLTEHYYGADQFYLPQATLSPTGQEDERSTTYSATSYTYDTHQLMMTEVTDALGNTVQATALDYEHLQPMQMVDLNGNTSEVKLDPLGRVLYTSQYGHEAGEAKGFAPLSEAPTDVPSTLQDLIEEPAKYIGSAQSYFYYDPFAWQERQTPVYSVALVAEQYPDGTSSLPDPATIQIAMSYNDGFGRALCSKAKVEPGVAFHYDTATGTVSTQPDQHTDSRWLTSGRVVYNNKGNPVKQYEPYYIDTPNYVSDPVLDTFGVSPTLYYDPLNRVTQTLTAKGFYVKHNWTAWEQTLSDENDTLLDSPYYAVNIADPDPTSPFYDTALTEAGKENLAYVAQYFANTPERIIVDNLGRTIIEEQINQPPDTDPGTPDTDPGKTLRTYHTYDILGRELSSADPRLSQNGLNNFEMTYSLVGEVLKTVSADAGTRWSLTNTLGNPLWRYDARQVTMTYTYDVLHRPTAVHVRKPASDTDSLALDQTVERMVYGDTPGAVDRPEACNLRGQLLHHYDQAGLVTTPSYSLLGAPLESCRQFKCDYKAEANWAEDSELGGLLEGTVYAHSSTHDALGRVIEDTDPEQNKVAPRYHPYSGRLNQITLTPHDDASNPIQVVHGITYNARNQRETISYGNGTCTTYSYDPKTFALTQLQTVNSQGKVLQDLTYVHDPVENVVSKTDSAQHTVYHSNQEVSPTATYVYDSLYRLIEGTGREKIGNSAGQAGGEIPILNPTADTNDNQALQHYVEKYSYDAGGNLTKTQHLAQQDSWTRSMVVSSTSNRAVLCTINGTDTPAPKCDQVDQYFDAHGNQIRTSQVNPLAAWDYRDNLQQATVVARASDHHDAEYYVYDSSGQRVRKVHERYGNGETSLKIEETLYLGHLEIRRTLQRTDSKRATVTKEYHSLRVMDDQHSVMTRDHWITSPPSGFDETTLRYHLSDHLGSCTVEVDEHGNQISYEEYSPFGASMLFIGTGSASQLKHYRYSGQERDSVTGFYYYGARYYAPWLCRWLSPDPAGTINGLNLYEFVTDDPETFWDVGGKNKKRKREDTKEGSKKKRARAREVLGSRNKFYLKLRGLAQRAKAGDKASIKQVNSIIEEDSSSHEFHEVLARNVRVKSSKPKGFSRGYGLDEVFQTSETTTFLAYDAGRVPQRESLANFTYLGFQRHLRLDTAGVFYKPENGQKGAHTGAWYDTPKGANGNRTKLMSKRHRERQEAIEKEPNPLSAAAAALETHILGTANDDEVMTHYNSGYDVRGRDLSDADKRKELATEVQATRDSLKYIVKALDEKNPTSREPRKLSPVRGKNKSQVPDINSPEDLPKYLPRFSPKGGPRRR